MFDSSASANPRHVLFFSFHYPPDQSAGGTRTQQLAQHLAAQDPQAKVTIFCSVPRRYGNAFDTLSLSDSSSNIRVYRFWIPYFGQGPLVSALSYSFYFVQTVPAALWLRPQIIVGTSAKLLTSFVAAFSACLTGARLFIDLRDTFADNFFYFYRWNKRILIQSFLMAIENIVLRCASSINMVSPGFCEAFVGWERVLQKYSISLTNFPNGIESSFRRLIVDCSQVLTYPESGVVKSPGYRVVYAGNLGEGQDILGLLESLSESPDTLQRMRQSCIQFEIFGSGAQCTSIKKLIESSGLADLVHYRGLLPRVQVDRIYRHADCLMLQLGLYNSLSMVIPTKVFEYAATPYPILFGASGFTHAFIDRISGTLGYRQCDAESFVDAAIRSMSISVNRADRELFLDEYDADTIYAAYAQHILSHSAG